MNTKHKNISGFTLIELLVVVAIIGLLSSVVLTSVNSARITADNARAVLTVDQYYKSLELYRDAYGYYPIADVAPLNPYCVPSGGLCLNGLASNAALDNKILENIGGLALVNGIPISFGATQINGLEYVCETLNTTAEGCIEVIFSWYLNKNSNCGNVVPLTEKFQLGNDTYCRGVILN